MLLFWFFFFWLNLKNKGSFGWKPLIFWNGQENTIFRLKLLLFLRIRLIEKNRYSNMLQAQQLLLSEKDAPTKFNFWPIVPTGCSKLQTLNNILIQKA